MVDVRSLPMSRRFPHFNREALTESLKDRGIRYIWMSDLGGRRKKILDESPNFAMRSASFRNYADYMLTDRFRAAIGRLVEVGAKTRTAYMCSEAVYFRCHRMLISDWLVAHGHEVAHIESVRPAKLHRVTAEARRDGDWLIYDVERRSDIARMAGKLPFGESL